MILKKISYKNKVIFDYFEIWLGENMSVFDHSPFNINGKIENLATCVSTQICPWCIKKYGLYSEADTTPEGNEETIEFYKSEDPEKLDGTCGIDGCHKGIAQYVDINWKDGFAVVDYEEEEREKITMKNSKVTIRMTDVQIKENPFITANGEAPFYRFIGEKFAGSYDNVKKIDCCKINVAKNIQTAWFDYARENGITTEDLSMMLLFSGPKVLDEVPESCVELEENAIEY